MTNVLSSKTGSCVVLCPLAALLALLGSGCDKKNVATPTPVLTRVAISGGADAVLTKSSVNFTATATQSDGSTSTVTPTWTVDNTTVATIDGNGRLNALVHGPVTITASYQGQTATRPVRVLSNYRGTWEGQYILRACDQSGAFAGSCADIGGVGTILPVALSLSQTEDPVTGQIAIGSLVGDITGNVTPDGHLVIGGSFPSSVDGMQFTLTVGGWNTRLAGPDAMAGRWAQSLSAINMPGNLYMECELVDMPRTSDVPVPMHISSFHARSLGAFLSRFRK